MSYLALARKWRPKSFSTLVGQEHVVRALVHALDQGRLHHAYLLTGTRGVGKTTIARILAKALNCEQGVSSAPCGACSSCLEIDAGRFVDLLEVDAATNTKVDQMRELLDSAAYAPTRGRYKVFVIDEVHMLSNSAFNAMLKTLEEPPDHIKFILATTDPQKIPVTVLSRCLQFSLKQMPHHSIVNHLSAIVSEEGIVFEPGALRHLAKAAAGSMRDALSLLDQAIAHGAGQLTEANVQAMLGTVGDDYLYALLDALRDENVNALIRIADDMATRSVSLEGALQEMATLFHRIALVQWAPEALLDPMERARLTPYSQAFDPEFLQLCYQIVVHGRAELDLAPDEPTGFCMTLLRLAAFRPESAAAGSTSVAAPAQAPAQQVAGSGKPPPSVGSGAPAWPQSPEDWHHLLTGTIALTAMSRQLAQHCEWIGAQDNGVLALRLPPDRRYLQSHRAKLEEEMGRALGMTVKIELAIGTPVHETPAVRSKNEAREQHQEALSALEQDPGVSEVMEVFNARIDPATLKRIETD
jgi:DNA polymerase-3 subunit gamma/tau